MTRVLIPRRLALLSLTILLSGFSPAQAQDSPFMFDSGTFANMMMQPNVDRMLKNNMRLARGEAFVEPQDVKSNHEDPALEVSTVAPPAGREGATADLLAESYPATSRAAAARTFRDLLTGYHEIESQFGIPRYDTAGALAAFLTGSYMAYRDTDFPDENFPPLVEQMRQILARNPEFAAASPAEKQKMYEHFAIIGMMSATTQMALKDNPGTPGADRIRADMKAAGKKYLEDFLMVDATRVILSGHGLSVSEDRAE